MRVGAGAGVGIFKGGRVGPLMLCVCACVDVCVCACVRVCVCVWVPLMLGVGVGVCVGAWVGAIDAGFGCGCECGQAVKARFGRQHEPARSLFGPCTSRGQHKRLLTKLTQFDVSLPE